jgi:hypothetical protein
VGVPVAFEAAGVVGEKDQVGFENAEEQERYNVADESGEQDVQESAAETIFWLLRDVHLRVFARVV